MNLINLQRCYDLIETIPEERLNMKRFRNNMNDHLYKKQNHKCKSVGCIIGHATSLDKWENIPKQSWGDEIDFLFWSEEFFGIDVNHPIWNFLFSENWGSYEKSKTKEQILKRIAYVIEHQDVPTEFVIPSSNQPRYKLIMP